MSVGRYAYSPMSVRATRNRVRAVRGSNSRPATMSSIASIADRATA